MDRRQFLHSSFCLSTLSALSANCVAAEETYKISVVAILASDQHTEVDKRLADFAKEVQKKQPHLTGFKVACSTTDKVVLGVTKLFPLVDRLTLDVTLNSSKTEEGKLTITVKPPMLDQVSYSCVCERAFSMATNYHTKSKEQLFIAITAKVCPPKEAVPPPDKPPVPPATTTPPPSEKKR